MSNTTEIQKAISNLLDAHGIAYQARFVPFNISRNRNESRPSLNWFCDFMVQGKQTLSVDYQQGVGHIPAKMTRDSKPGTAHRDNQERLIAQSGHGLVKPKPADVLHCIVMDDPRDLSFDDWASEYGYDADSRKAEAIYRACQEQTAKGRAFFGPALLAEFAALLQDY